MFKSFFAVNIVLIGSLMSITSHAASADDILGDWSLTDETYGGERAVGRFLKDKYGNYYMKIVHNNLNITNPKTTCYKCPKPFTDKPIQNMTIIWNLKPVKGSTHQYKDAYGIDPYSGGVFRGEIVLSNDNKRLNIRASSIEAAFLGKRYVFLRK